MIAIATWLPNRLACQSTGSSPMVCSTPLISPYFGPPAVSHRVTLLADRRLPRGYVAIHDYETAVVKGKRETATSVAIYQQRGDVLSAVYVHPGNRTTPAQLRATAFHAAEAAARRLAQVA